MKQKLLSIITLATLYSGLSYAQVTIGSNKPPVAGALLDLKTETDGSSKLGLGLPRVELKDLTQLTMGDNEITDNPAGTWEAHTGLVVYNVAETTDICNPLPLTGLYVWIGHKWQFLGNEEDGGSPDVHYYEDTRPHGGALAGTTQTYPYRQFGTAGEWMLENMRYIPDADASVQLVASATSDYTDKSYTYPQVPATIVSPGTKPASWREAQGLLYSYSAATLGAQDDVNDLQGHGERQEDSQPKVQGICPSGWHIPTDREWNELEEELYNNAGKYSTYTAEELADVSKWDPISKADAWNSAWNTTRGSWRGSSTNNGGHGHALKSSCNVPGKSTPTGGKSLSTAQGGFNVLLAGRASAGSTSDYGARNYLWSSSSRGIYYAWFRYFQNNYSQVYREHYVRTYLFSVRCKKDNP